MNQITKIFAIGFLVFQSLVIFQLLPKQVNYESYAVEVILRIFFTVSKVNHAYDFFTSESDLKEYTYTSNKVVLYQLSGDSIDTHTISNEGSITYLVNPINRTRIAHLQNIATNDTLLYSAIVRSEAIHFLAEHPSYSVIGFDVLKHRCKAKIMDSQFVLETQVDTVFSNLFSMIE